MVTLMYTISRRVARYLEKAGSITQDMQSTYLNFSEDDEDSLLQLQGASVSYRIAMGPQQGQKIFTLQTLPAHDNDNDNDEYVQLANVLGFSLHAGVFANIHETENLERLCHYISRTAISEQRLSMTKNRQVRYELKPPYRDGTPGERLGQVFFSPIDFIGKLTALVTPVRLNLTRFHDMLLRINGALNSNLRALITASLRGKNSPNLLSKEMNENDKPFQAKSMSWAQRPVTGQSKRVFNIDITECERCENTM